MPFIGSLSKSWIIAIGLALALFYQSWSTGIELRELKGELAQAYVDKGASDVALTTAVQLNQSLNKTIESMNQQFIDAQKADDWLRTFNATMDSKLENTILDLGKLFDDQTQNVNSGCTEQFSDGVYQRMLDHYRTETGSGDSG